MKYLAFALLFIVLIFMVVFFNVQLENNFGSQVRFVNDSEERGIFYDRGSWLPLKKIPYKESFSEYPELTTYFLAMPHAVLSFFYSTNYTRDQYNLVFSLITVTLLFASIVLLYNLLGKKKYLAFLMLLPATFYFTYNRFDILPVFLSILSIKFLSEEKYKLSAFFLALGVLSKWYLIILFPIFISLYHSRYKKINWAMIGIFCLTGFAGIFSTIASGGIEAFLVPYKFHAARGLNNESLFFLLKKILGSDLWFGVFFILQFSVIPFCIFKKIDSFRKAINWTALAILIFMLFAKFYSPQWILWILPFLILRAKNGKDIFFIVLFDLVTYLYFPVIYDGFRGLFYPIIVIKTAILLYFIVDIVKDLSMDINEENQSRPAKNHVANI